MKRKAARRGFGWDVRRECETESDIYLSLSALNDGRLKNINKTQIIHRIRRSIGRGIDKKKKKHI